MNAYPLKAVVIAGLGCLLATKSLAQHDPGVRGGFQNTAGALQQRGIPIPHPPVISPNPTTGATIEVNELASFLEGVRRAGQLESTCDTCSDVTEGSPVVGLGELDPEFPQFHTNSNGVGARHNADQCFACHAQPTLGGSGGYLVPNPGTEARAAARESDVPARSAPFRQAEHRPVVRGAVWADPRSALQVQARRHARRRRPSALDRARNQERSHHCELQYRPSPTSRPSTRSGNLSFRIPLQMTGLGLIESIQDREILARHDATAAQRAALGITGHPNRSGNDGTITRFGWKAQNKSIAMFAGEAYNVEMGITNELFPTATEEDPSCNGPEKPAPNDVTRTDTSDAINQSFNNPLHILADWMQFQMLMRFTDGPQTDPRPSQSAQRGRQVFNDIGCASCHTPQMQTAPVMNSAVLENRPVNLFSDLLVHHMGATLADDIVQGAAGPDEFRTTPLWGVGQRMFFLHDGRTSDLLEAINAHLSPGKDTYAPSEANAVIANFRRLSAGLQQTVLDFLRSL